MGRFNSDDVVAVPPTTDRRKNWAVRVKTVLAGVAFLALAAGVVWWAGLRSQLAQTDVSAARIEGVIADEQALLRMLMLSGQGWMSSSTYADQMQSVLDSLVDARDMTLDSVIALNALEWVVDAINGLSYERNEIDDMTLNLDHHQVLREDVLGAYRSHESAVRELANLIVNWDATFGERRAQSIQSIRAMADGDVVTHDSLDVRLRESIAAARRQKQDLDVQREQRRIAVTELERQSERATAVAVAGGLTLLVLGGLALARHALARVRT